MFTEGKHFLLYFSVTLQLESFLWAINMRNKSNTFILFWTTLLCSVSVSVSSLKCFTGGADDSCNFTCHCVHGDQCVDSTGECPSGCATEKGFLWSGDGCQIGNVALGKIASQTGTGLYNASFAVDGEYDVRTLASGPCSEPEREGEEGDLWWIVDLGHIHVVKEIIIYGAEGRGSNSLELWTDLYVLDGIEEMSCGTISGPSGVNFYKVSCPPKTKGQYVRIEQTNKHISSIASICELSVVGYHYHECLSNLYGPGCLLECHCSVQCDFITGACIGDCKAGYRKSNNKREICDRRCYAGDWGPSCKHKCNCDTSCGIVTGRCFTKCVAGFQGSTCQELCDDDYWGIECQYQCNCLTPCNKKSGECPSRCVDGFMGSTCQDKCRDGYWGYQCQNPCNCQISCDKSTGECPSECTTGYKGPTCQERCDGNHWGANCLSLCNCESSCNNENGICRSECDVGYYGGPGAVCRECEDNTWGKGDVNGCENECHCKEPCDKGRGECGDAGCVAGYEGMKCHIRCEDGRWGEYCKNMCMCKDGAVCDKETGACDECLEWYVGIACQNRLPSLIDIEIKLKHVVRNNVTLGVWDNYNASINYLISYKTSEGDWEIETDVFFSYD